MREILFKAKRIDNGEWVEGLIWKKKPNANKIFISCFPDMDDNEEVYVVDPNTICQYTGLTDKNGNKIWENDIIEVKNNKRHFISQIEWDDYAKGFSFQDSKSTWCGLDAFASGGCYRFGCKVIGNVFDNADLVEG